MKPHNPTRGPVKRQPLRTKNPAQFLVIDLEATTSDDGSLPPNEMETIEIGAVLVNAKSLLPVDEFQTFDRPVRHPQLLPL